MHTWKKLTSSGKLTKVKLLQALSELPKFLSVSSPFAPASSRLPPGPRDLAPKTMRRLPAPSYPLPAPAFSSGRPRCFSLRSAALPPESDFTVPTASRLSYPLPAGRRLHDPSRKKTPGSLAAPDPHLPHALSHHLLSPPALLSMVWVLLPGGVWRGFRESRAASSPASSPPKPPRSSPFPSPWPPAPVSTVLSPRMEPSSSPSSPSVPDSSRVQAPSALGSWQNPTPAPPSAPEAYGLPPPDSTAPP